MLESLLNACHDEDSLQLSAKDIMEMFVDLIRICFKYSIPRWWQNEIQRRILEKSIDGMITYDYSHSNRKQTSEIDRHIALDL